MNIEEYSKIAPQYYSNKIPTLLENYLKNTKWNSLLDCGCGDGSLISALKNHGFLDDRKIYGIDLSSNRIELIKKIDNKINANIDNAEEMNTIQNSSIDFFVSEQVIEHVDQKKMLKNIYRVVEKDGIVYLSTIFKKWYAWYFYRNNGKWVIDPTHLREYTKDSELLDLIIKNIFYIIENKKNILVFPVLDFFVKRLNVKNRNFFGNSLFSSLRKIKILIPGYYNWEIIFKKIN